MKRIQRSFLNLKKAGRPAIHDKGIRHTVRPRIHKTTMLHLTIKVRENKADIKNKRILKLLHHAIKRARLQRLKVLHYTLEYNHVHLLVEATNNQILHKGMQAFGITFSKWINRLKLRKGTVYKHRYHFHALRSTRERKNALNYIFTNGVKHGRTRSRIDPYNSFVGLHLISADVLNTILRSDFLTRLRMELLLLLDRSLSLDFLLTPDSGR